MSERAASDRAGEDGPGVRLLRLQPPGDPATVEGVVEALGLWDRTTAPAARPRVLLNMISTADGRATLRGRSGTISGPADRALFHGLRTAVDGVLVGAGTVRSERYGRLIPDAARRRLRSERGRPEEPLACIVSGRMALDRDLPLLAEPSARVAILTASQASLSGCRAQIEYVRTGAAGRLDLAGALSECRARFDVRTLLCEGGPHLAHELLAAGLLDELLLALAPTLAGGEPAAGQALRIISGPELDPPVALELLGVLESDSFLFLRYGVSARE